MITSKSAVEMLSALGHPSRLEVYRTILKHGPNGICAGTIALKLTMPPSTLSGHLNILKRAKLLTSRREHKQIRYAVNVNGTRKLLQFLTRDCCSQQAGICDDIVDCSWLPQQLEQLAR